MLCLYRNSGKKQPRCRGSSFRREAVTAKGTDEDGVWQTDGCRPDAWKGRSVRASILGMALQQLFILELG